MPSDLPRTAPPPPPGEAPAPEAFIDLRGVTYAYGGRAPVLDGLDFTLRRGDRIGLIAPNGSGKTTLFHLILGLVKPDRGTIRAFGRPVREEKDFREGGASSPAPSPTPPSFSARCWG